MMLKFLLCLLLIITFYYFFKKVIIKPAYYLTLIFGFIQKYSIQECTHSMSFILVTFSHLFFAFILVLYLPIHFEILYLKQITPENILLGVLLGLGLACSTAILVMFIIRIILLFSSFNEVQVYATLSSGWMKKYEYVKKTLPVYIAFSLILIQLSCEEIIFRGVFLNFLKDNGIGLAIFLSTLLFTIMQIFQMPTMRGALFPVVSALIMGSVHGLIFAMDYSILILIISHTVFFLFLTW